MKAKKAINYLSLSIQLYTIMKNSEVFKKAVLMAAGFASYSKQKLEELANEISENSDMTQEEGKKFIDELLEKSKEARSEFEGKVEDIAKKVFEKMHIATTDDLKKLESRLEKLEANDRFSLG